MTEQEQFLEEVNKTPENGLDQTLEVEPEKEIEEDSEQKAKNRRERRLLEQNQRLREEAIAASSKLQGIQEAQKLQGGTETAEYLKLLEPIYGDVDENGKPDPKRVQATELMKQAFLGMKESAKQELLEEISKRESKESEAVKQEEQALEQMADHWEDEYGIDMSDDATRKAIYALTEKFSSKDAEGNIKEYADPDAIAEMFKSSQNQSNGRAKELASRSMVRSGASQPSKLEEDATWKYLKEQGIF